MRKILRLSICTLAACFVFIMVQHANAKNVAEGSTARSTKQTDKHPRIEFTVSMSKPSSHLLEVEMRVSWTRMPERLELKMPVWTPGSYLIREYARHVQDFTASDGEGKEMTWRKINKNTWEIDSRRKRDIIVSYKVYSNELTVRTNELNDEHAFWNNAALLMFPKDHLAAPSTVKVEPHSNWKVATGLPRVDGNENIFRADNFDVLYDSPFEVSDFKEITFDVLGKPHRIVVTGEGNYDLKAIARDTTKIAEECVKIFGELPVENYLIILNLRGRGGLEHLNSTALQWGRFNFKPRARYVDFLHLVAHEYFHLWNVKRIRPDALGPFDYENENYTKLLWFAEGTTAYYEGILLRRAGIITDKQFLSTKATMISDLQYRPGRFQTSLEEASLDAWIKYYRQDENSVNNQISYYDKGEIVNMLLDVRIRTLSQGARSLDDVMRHLYDEYYKKNRNVTPQDIQKVSEMMAGQSLEDFFSAYVRGRQEIDYNSIVNGIGLSLNASKNDAGRSYIGADLAEEQGRLTVRTVRAGTPAFEQGLNTGDQIVAVDGHRANLSFLQTYIGERKPGDTVRLTIFRFDRLRDIEFVLGENLRESFTFTPLANATELQKRLYQEYLISPL